MRRTFHPGRRRVLAVPLVLIPAVAFGQANKRVDESEPQAEALGYKHDVANVDKAKFKNFQPGQHCGNCNFFKGKADAEWGPCDIFGGREVATKGWCSAWVKKAA